MAFTEAVDDLVRAVAACATMPNWWAMPLNHELCEMPDGCASEHVAITTLTASTGALAQDQL
ncbi:MAG: hypothetical protein AAGK77_08290 [Pseudomonadota bacterium]